jgi:hypothetical protein
MCDFTALRIRRGIQGMKHPNSANFFDDFTRFLAGGMSRRDFWQLAWRASAAGLFAAATASCGRDSTPSEPSGPDGSLRGRVNVRAATASENSAMLGQAQLHPAFRRYDENLRAAFMALTFEATTGAVLQIDNAPSAQVVVQRYRVPNNNNRIRLVFGTTAGLRFVFTVMTRSDGRPLLATHLRANNQMAVMAASDFTTAQHSLPRRQLLLAGAFAPVPQQSSAGGCDLCLESCRSAVSAAGLQQDAFVLLQSLQSGGSVAQQLGEAIVQEAAGSAASAALAMAGWPPGDALGPVTDCSTTGAMCGRFCGGCNSPSDCPAGVCVSGECKSFCGDQLCSSASICQGGPGGSSCVPLTALPCTIPGGVPMGFYWTGATLSQSCCAFAGVNCGAYANGMWAGCCPAGASICVWCEGVVKCQLLGGPAVC